MGQHESKHKGGPSFNEHEMGFLDQIFHQMAVRSPDDTISKDTFLAFFDLPGVLGDRLFEVFDAKGNNVIDFEEFINGYHKFARGNAEDKIAMLFSLFDLDGAGGITQEELTTVLLSIVTPPNRVMQEPEMKEMTGRASGIASPILESEPSFGALMVDTPDSPKNAGLSASFLSQPPQGSFGIDEVVSQVTDMVKAAFGECDADGSGRLDLEEFRRWLNKNPELIQSLDDLFVQLAWDLPKQQSLLEKPGYSMMNAEMASQRYSTARTALSLQLTSQQIPVCEECKLKFVSSRKDIPAPQDDGKSEEYDFVIMTFAFDESRNSTLTFCPKCAKELTHPRSSSTLRLKTEASSSLVNLEDRMEGMARVPGGRWGRLRPRYLVLQGKFLYLYKNQSKPFPEQVVFVQGYFVDLVKEGSRSSGVPYLVKLTPPRGSTSKAVMIYVESKELGEKWLQKLEQAAQTVDIKRHYELKKQIGKGSFAQVYTATEKKTGEEVAVKVIQKKAIDGKQKEYIRIELSVMKLVKHPHVVQLTNVFETRSHIYMVMPLYNGGDLYDYMKNNARHGLEEEQSRLVIWNVLHALRYLHCLGIVHRDLKPENLLLKRDKDPTDVVITDFGLSKFAAPHEAMKAACGTLSYVAPEVLKLDPQGYGKEVDLWSTGVIMFLTLRAKLPFHDSTKHKIIARILRQKVQMIDPHWEKITTEAKDLIRRLLTKSPQQRISVEEAMDHSWFDSIRQEKQADLEKTLLSKEAKEVMTMIRNTSVRHEQPLQYNFGRGG